MPFQTVSGERLYLAAEEAGSMLLRWFLKALRPFTIAVFTEDGQEVLRVVRPFRFYFHRAEVVGPQGQSLGLIERRFSILRRVYSVLDRSGPGSATSSSAPSCTPGHSRSEKTVWSAER